jgi:hypothetical protein
MKYCERIRKIEGEQFDQMRILMEAVKRRFNSQLC